MGQPANRRNKSNLERFDHRIHVPIVWCIKKGKIGFPPFDLSVDPTKENNICKEWIGLYYTLFKKKNPYSPKHALLS